MHAYALLPDHIHLLLRVADSTDISKVMHSLKRNFTMNYKRALARGDALHLWQRGFWDHVIRDDRDYERHLDYIRYNPVKHGLVAKPEDCTDTSYSEYLRRGWYEIGWGHSEPDALTGMDSE
jgi:putative transposase